MKVGINIVTGKAIMKLVSHDFDQINKKPSTMPILIKEKTSDIKNDIDSAMSMLKMRFSYFLFILIFISGYSKIICKLKMI